MTNALLSTALAYARQGWAVFPLHHPTARGCSCRTRDCTQVAKHPYYHPEDLPHGHNSASRDPEVIARWWQRWPQANIGLALDDLVVIDIDPRHGGHLTVDDLEAEHGKFPPTVESLTGGGGRHLFYRHPGASLRCGVDALGPGVDLKTLGGYVVLPPSRHASGECYEWEATSAPGMVPFADLPAWLPLDDTTEEDPETGQRRSLDDYTGARVGDDYNRRVPRAELRALLHDQGARLLQTVDGVDYFCRPGKTGHSYSGTLGHLPGNRLRTFSPNWPLFPPKRGGYQPFAVYTYLTHRGDFQAAIKALAALGYGADGPTGATPHRGVSADTPPMTLAQVEAVFQRWLHTPDTGLLRVLLGAIAANLMEGADPVWLMLIGGSSWGKTEHVQAASGLPYVHLAATLTEASLLSGTPRKDKAPTAKGGLLREIGLFGLLLLKDFTSTLSMNRDQRAATMAALREIYDGHWTRHVGVDGGRTLDWEGKLGVIAGVTTTIDRHHAVMSTMGERFINYRLVQPDEEAQAHQGLQNIGQEKAMRTALAAAVKALFAGLPPQITRSELSDKEETRLIAWARLAARGRSPIERDSYSREIELIPDPEAPVRLAQVFYRLFSGMVAIGTPREDAWVVLCKVAMDCMPAIRWKVLRFLLRSGTLPRSTTDIATGEGYPTETARRALEDLTAHGLLQRTSQGKGRADVWDLTLLTRMLSEHLRPQVLLDRPPRQEATP